MNMRLNPRNCLATLLAAALLAGCATRGGTADEPCNVGAAAAVAGIVGAVIGARKDGKDGAIKGAAAGAGLGALTCLAVNVHSRRTRTAEESDREYRRAQGKLPSEPQVVSYTSSVSGNPVRRGQPLTVSSAVEIVNGVDQPVREVREELQIYNPDNSQIKSGIKPFSATAGGRYENQFELKLPDNAPQGVYRLRTVVYLNGKETASRDLNTQVVRSAQENIVVAVR